MRPFVVHVIDQTVFGWHHFAFPPFLETGEDLTEMVQCVLRSLTHRHMPDRSASFAVLGRRFEGTASYSCGGQVHAVVRANSRSY